MYRVGHSGLTTYVHNHFCLFLACMRISQAVENMLYPFLLVWEPWTLIFPWLALVLLSALWILCLDSFLFPANVVKMMYTLGAMGGSYIFLWVTFTACILFVCTLLPSCQAAVSGEISITNLSDLIFSRTGLSGHARSSDHGAQTWQIAGDILSGVLFSSMIAAVLQNYTWKLVQLLEHGNPVFVATNYKCTTYVFTWKNL